jgi:hypothetical protein
MRIIRAEPHLVSIMHPSTIGTFDHSRLFSILFGSHDDIRLPHAIRKAAMLVALHDVLYRDIPASYACSGGHPQDSTGASLAFSLVGDMVAFLEVAEGCFG